MATEYATTDQLNEFMVMKAELPNPQIVGSDRLLETVGEGNNTATRFFLDNAYVISGTYTLYYGATELAALSQTLTETTHYTLDKDIGKITLTTAGVTLVGTNSIYAAYSYNIVGFTDTELQTQLDRTEAMVDKATANHWADGTVATSNYNQILDEKYDGQGIYKRDYFSKQRPLPDVSTTLDGDEAIGQTELTVVSSTGFPDTGYISIGKEKITYSAKTATTFTVTATTIAHSDGDEVFPWVFEASSTVDGTAPTWTVLEKGADYDLDLDTGRVHFSASELNITDAQAFSLNPELRVPNRLRMSYIWGNDSIPADITNLTLMLAAQDLLHRAVRKAHAQGFNDFNPDIVNIDEAWITATIKSYKNMRASTAM